MASICSWSFQCAGVFGGVSAFTDESGETEYFLKIDFYGGRVTISGIGEKNYQTFREKPLGLECRISGKALFNGGNPKFSPEKFEFADMKGFKPLEDSDLMEGMVIQGRGELSYKKKSEREDGTFWHGVTVKAVGGYVRGVQVAPEAFERLPVGDCIIYGQVFSEVSTVFADGRRRQDVRNTILIKGAKSV